MARHCLTNRPLFYVYKSEISVVNVGVDESGLHRMHVVPYLPRETDRHTDTQTDTQTETDRKRQTDRESDSFCDIF